MTSTAVSDAAVRSARRRRLDLAHGLGLAAAPTFAIMALATVWTSRQPAAFCGTPMVASPIGGMATMYLLMSAFHLATWLRRAASPPTG
jgi:hypothetical protein